MRDGREKVSGIIRILEKHYGIPRRDGFSEPLDELVFTILSQNTNDRNRDRAWSSLKRAYTGWEEVLSCGAKRLSGIIRVAGLAEQKSRNIINILRELKKRYGRLSLKFLRKSGAEEARKFLLSFNGVGPKTAACVLLFSLKQPAFPVDTHIFRVAGRLGLLPKKSDANDAHEIMEDIVPRDKYLSFHINLIQHGRRICHPERPECHICPVSRHCVFFIKQKKNLLK